MTIYLYKNVEIDISEEIREDNQDKNDQPQQLLEHEFILPSKSGSEIKLDAHQQHIVHGSDMINGKMIHLIKTQSGKYISHYYPYMIFDTKLDVAKTLIDYVPEFGAKEMKNESDIDQ
ncbi:MAG: hypothetical protein AB7U98_14875 [Candidatus Nitrosocosmicus sp.]